ncbi:cobalt-precorrin-6A reductase [Skermania piniformis]|uniref:cobalt-precorrin-6A reductase n=1 Tax=Skermania pinensis TaxID=39122 RepID=UPI0035709A50
MLLLGGSAEARELAGRMAGRPGYHVVSSLAGRVRDPQLPAGEVRVGGFGGVAGLRNWLRDNDIDVVVVATHPFAARITTNAIRAATDVRLPTLLVRRPAWVAQPGDRWESVASLTAAAARIADERVFLTIGRQGVAEFAGCAAAWFLIRAIDPPNGPLPAHAELLLERGPFTVEHDAELLVRHRIELLVSKNSGGPHAAGKLVAARAAGIPVLLVDRPPSPPGVTVVTDAAGAADWLAAQRGVQRA